MRARLPPSLSRGGQQLAATGSREFFCPSLFSPLPTTHPLRLPGNSLSQIASKEALTLPNSDVSVAFAMFSPLD